MIPCTICSVTLTGPADYHNHINGRRHQDNVVLQRLSRLSVQDPPRPQQPPPPRQPPQPPRNQARPRGGGAARPGPAHISPRPHGLNSFDPARSHHAAPPNVNGRGRGRAPRPPPPTSPAHRSQFPHGNNAPRSPPPRQAPVNGFNNSGPGHQPPGPKKPIGKGYQVDFEVIRNTETETRWKSYDFIPSERGVTGQPAVSLAPINATRKGSVRGFSSRRITPLRNGKGYTIEFGFNPRNIARGVHIVVAHVTYFVDGRNVSKTLKLRAVVGSPEDHEELQPVKPFEPTPREQLRDDWQRGRLVQNKPQNNAQDFERLPFYDVTDQYWRAVQSRADRNDEAVKIHLQSLLPYRMETETYKDHWTHLLWHEEIAMCNQLKQYDMNGVPVPPVPGVNQQHSLTVPGLQEKRPSVIVSDLIAIRKPDQARPVYGGAVTEVRQSDVILQVHGDFPSIRGELWDVRFTVNRLLLRRMHESVGRAASYFDRILFPEPRHQKARVPPSTRLSIDRRISSNPEQKLAIEQIVSLAPGDIPFVIFGPPGTGKTTVVVEAIHQVLTTNPDSRLLVCAPSNSAADLLGVRLSKTYNYLPRKLLRLNALTRPYDALDITLRKHSLVDGSGRTFKMPSKEELMSYRIVVTTCFSASTPRALRIEDHFTHIFIDEAGHASEPEIMIPILQNVSRDTRVILSGDPKQLGPIVHSRPCEALGMAESFLERLTKRPVYKVGPATFSESVYSIPSVVKLLQNYRNHPAILRFPNLVFYGGELQPYADPMLSQKLLRFGQLPRQGFPIIFHSVCGENQREGKSPSYFNIDEATLVKHYVKALLDGNYGLNANQVGVITPYRQQCVKIRQLFQKIGFGAIDVKVTEDWQGQERRVIIISTVRSDPELLHEGALKFLGFVASPKRTNVALTRAQALLIVIGNGHVLTLDPFWNAFIRYVHASGGCRGDDLYLSEGGFSEGQFSGLKKSNRDYLEDIDNEGLWDVLKGATSAWPGH